MAAKAIKAERPPQSMRSQAAHLYAHLWLAAPRSSMHHAQQLDAVREIVRQKFESQCGHLPDEILEKILIRAGFYCGRCFTYAGLRAVWFIEENQVKFYGEDGRFLCACSALGAASAARRVA